MTTAKDKNPRMGRYLVKDLRRGKRQSVRAAATPAEFSGAPGGRPTSPRTGEPVSWPTRRSGVRSPQGSYLFTLVSEIQFELPSLKTHQHTAKFVPGDLAAVDNEKRHATIVITIRLHHSSHGAMVRDMQRANGRTRTQDR